MEVFNLNIRPGKACPVLHCSQFDKGRMFRANLFDGAEVFTLTGSETLSIIEKKADGNMVTIGVTNTSDNYVVFGTTEQMTALAGCQLCELRIVDGEDLIGSMNFLLDCEESPDTGIESESAIHNLEQQISEAVAEQYDADSVIFDNTPTAGHGVGHAVTSEGVKNYVDDEIAALTIPEELDDLQDVELTSPTAGQIMEYDGAKWKNVANPASTTNFGAPYDENTTYNVPSLVIENNLLYKLNEGEVDVTGPFDPTKWTQTSLAELTAEDFPLSSTDSTPISGSIGDLSALTTTIKSSLVGAVNAVNSDLDNKTFIDQKPGASLTIVCPIVFGFYYADQWFAYVPLPFIAKNNNYSINFSVVNAANIGEITNKISITSKSQTYFRIVTTRDMPSFPDQYSCNLGLATFVITFA